MAAILLFQIGKFLISKFSMFLKYIIFLQAVIRSGWRRHDVSQQQHPTSSQSEPRSAEDKILAFFTH